MAMGNLRRKLQDLGEHFYCPIHPDEVLLCSACDMLDLPPAEWEELRHLLDQAGYLKRAPFESHSTCWRCDEGNLACLACLDERGDPPEMELMDADAIDRLQELGGKLVPPWLV
jgi:hypothetical protein